MTGSQTSDGKRVFELKVPGLNIDAKLPYDGTSVTLADGSKASMAIAGLDYSLFAFWLVTPSSSSGNAFLGLATTGYQTPVTGVPNSGTATYAGNGGVIGAVYIAPQTGGIAGGTVRGDTNLTIDFSKSSISGALTNMTITPAGGGAVAPWNTVNLSGSLNGSSASGTAQSAPNQTLPQNGYSFSVAYGRFDGNLYGPHGEEIGAIWILNDSGGSNRSALGVFAAQKQ